MACSLTATNIWLIAGLQSLAVPFLVNSAVEIHSVFSVTLVGFITLDDSILDRVIYITNEVNVSFIDSGVLCSFPIMSFQDFTRFDFSLGYIFMCAYYFLYVSFITLKSSNVCMNVNFGYRKFLSLFSLRSI